MDYPVDRMQILLLVEADDRQTQQAIATAGVLPPFEVVLVPVSQPRTKPKACNHGLNCATGDLLVIYDAEDRPETDQLKKAALCFSEAPADRICLQAQLNYYNRDRNVLTRLFTAEYSCWFDYCLPGLFLLEAPIPPRRNIQSFPASRPARHRGLGSLQRHRGPATWASASIADGRPRACWIPPPGKKPPSARGPGSGSAAAGSRDISRRILSICGSTPPCCAPMVPSGCSTFISCSAPRASASSSTRSTGC